jgi:flavin-dependent thymidylate synthase
MGEFNSDKRILLSNFVTNTSGNVYAFRNLPEEVKAMLFSLVSRSSKGFRENLLELLTMEETNKLLKAFTDVAKNMPNTTKKASSFHEKWVLKHRHMSIAEHAVASLAFENVSIIAAKAVENTRLASYLERSTRYQVFEKGRYVKPAEIKGEMVEVYNHSMNKLFDFYNECVEHVQHAFIQQLADNMEEKKAVSIAKVKACDVCRYILPAGTLTSFVMTANARSYMHAISKLAAGRLPEERMLANKMREELSKVMPTFGRADGNEEYLSCTEALLERLAKEYGTKMHHETPKQNYAKLLFYDKLTDERVASALLYKHLNVDYSSLINKINREEAVKIIRKSTEHLDEKSWPLRGFEFSHYVFEIVVDYGAYRDIQRHRICSMVAQPLGCELGFETPAMLKHMGLSGDYKRCMEDARRAYEALSQAGYVEACYVVPLAYRVRVLVAMNLRELWHFITLRAKPAGHESYRQIALNMLKELHEVQPEVAELLEEHLNSEN